MMPATILFVYFGFSAIDYKNDTHEPSAYEYDDVLLLGGGHAHMELLRLSKSDKEFQSKLKMVTDNPYSYYSGMATGWLEGIYSEDDVRIDIPRLCNIYDIPLIIGTADFLDPVSRQIVLKDGTNLKYGLISINLGSKPALHPLSTQIPDSRQFTLKPFSELKALLESMDTLESGTIVIAGSGAAAAEVAASVSARLLSKPLCRVVLITKEDGQLRKNGVNAVKEAPVLYSNIPSILAKTPENLKNYRQKKYQLAIYNMGRRTAVLSYGPLVISGKLPWKLKNMIDTAYMQKHKK